MATLFFESFNLSNPDSSLYLDPEYWSRPSGISTPSVAFCDFGVSNTPYSTATQGHLKISGYYLDTNPPQYPLPLQLSGISGLNSDQIYISFRVAGLTHNDKYGNSFPYSAKFFTLCDGDNESLTFETVQISGESIQGIASPQPLISNTGLGISVKQSGNEIGLFDLRIEGIVSYKIFDCSSYFWPDVTSPQTHFPLSITTSQSNENRFVHLEFLIDRTTNIINLKVEGFDVFNRLTSYPYNYNSSGQLLGNINNIKFFPKGIKTSSANSSCSRFLNGLNGGSLSIDDLVIINNSGDSPNIWIGPRSRIFNLPAREWYSQGYSYIGLTDWTAPVTTRFTLQTRDGDSNYIYSETSGQIASFKPDPYVPGTFSDYFSNGIGGIRMYNDVRKTFLNSDFINVYGTGDKLTSGNYQEIGSRYTVTNTSYGIKNSFIFNNPSTLSPWTTGTFFTTAGGSVEVSGFYGIKKL